MSPWFYASVAGLFVACALHILSVGHSRLVAAHGVEAGLRRGRLYGAASGALESVCLVGLWISPQPALPAPPLDSSLAFLSFRVWAVNLLLSSPFLVAGAWLGLSGLMAVGMRVAETHSTPGGLVTTGVYSLVRHPQYLGWLLAHVGASILASAQASLLFTPILIAVVYVISRAEEADLSEAFGDEYRLYREMVPMLLPWPRKQWRGRQQAQKRIKA